MKFTICFYTQNNDKKEKATSIKVIIWHTHTEDKMLISLKATSECFYYPQYTYIFKQHKSCKKITERQQLWGKWPIEGKLRAKQINPTFQLQIENQIHVNQSSQKERNPNFPKPKRNDNSKDTQNPSCKDLRNTHKIYDWQFYKQPTHSCINPQEIGWMR